MLGPTQCAAFLKDRMTSAILALSGQPCRSANATCIVFDTLDSAEAFCEAKVGELPDVRCEIYDSAGLANPALLMIVHPDHQKQGDTGSSWSRRRRPIAVVLFSAAGPLIWIDVRRANTLILPTFLAFNCILAGLRLLLWDFGVKERDEERRKGLEAHRRVERGDR